MRPGAERAVIVAAVRQQGGVQADSVTARCRVKCDVNRGMSAVGEIRALVEAEISVRVAQHQGRDAAIRQFLTQTASQGHGDVFLHQCVAEDFSGIVATMAGVHHREVAARG